MAQPVFDGHPLEDYFHDSGEPSELIPGGIPDLALQPYLTGHPPVSKHAERMEKICFLVFRALETLSSFFSPDHMSLRTRAFAERFKYGVISSSLLSPAFAATPMVESHRRTPPSIPGRLSSDHSRTPSGAESIMTDTLSLSMPPDSPPPVWPLTLSFTAAVAALSAQLYLLTFLLLVATLYYMHVHRLDRRSKPDVMTPSLLALQHMISAGQLWDTVVNDAFTLLENEERSMFYGPASPLTPSSSLRVSLSTSLLTTQTQCDNVRQLLSAITSPSELAQLSEMYAPPSPMKPSFSPSSDAHRPLSHPGLSPRATPPSDRTQKRATWNGSYASLAVAGTPPPFPLVQRREKRRSDLRALLGTTSPTPVARARSRSTLSSPSLPLAEVSEEEDGMVTAKSSVGEEEEEEVPSFGAAALGLYRRRVQGGLRALALPPHGTPLSSPSPRTRGGPTMMTPYRSTLSPASKYTRMQTTRHPLSLSSLRQALQSALASKRFACAHLLALRFEDDADEVYWEDVRAVMDLLTSTLVDATARLSEVLEAVEASQLRIADEADEGGGTPSTPSSVASPRLTRAMVQGVVSFAPAPSALARFGAHVDVLATALDDARASLAQCVGVLKEAQAGRSPGHSSHPSTASSGSGPPPGGEGGGEGTVVAHPALQAYERLRRELGLALRECERGRARLVDVVAPPTPSTTDDDAPVVSTPVEGEREGEREAEKEAEAEDEDAAEVRVTVVSPPSPPGSGWDVDADVDDGRPPIPIDAAEQVYEADAVAGNFTRPRSTLSREARIRAAKAERAAAAEGGRLSRLGLEPCCPDLEGLPSPPLEDTPARERQQERWGPSGEVVQELKDVIWKVGQRRRHQVHTTVVPVVVPEPVSELS